MMFRAFVRTRRGFAVAAVAVAAAAAATATAAVTVTGYAVATSAAGGPAAIMIRDAANGTTVPVAAGDRIELILSSSYWDVAGSSSSHVLRQDGPAVLMPRPSSCPDIPGIGCTPVQIDFTALAAGRAVITASRSSCGEALRCMPDQTRFTVTVIVRNQK